MSSNECWGLNSSHVTHAYHCTTWKQAAVQKLHLSPVPSVPQLFYRLLRLQILWGCLFPVYMPLTFKKGIILTTNGSLTETPVLSVSIDQEIKLLGFILNCRLLWTKHIDELAVKMGNGIFRLFIQALIFSTLDTWPSLWSGATLDKNYPNIKDGSKQGSAFCAALCIRNKYCSYA